MLNPALIAIVLAYACAQVHAEMIAAHERIRHGLWLAGYIAVGYGIGYLLYGPVRGIFALLLMACVFSTWFRTFLNTRRGLLWSYMGPRPGVDSANRSRYDLLCWRIAERLGWPPVFVALAAETSVAVVMTLALAFAG